jgi:hypothetical protein
MDEESFIFRVSKGSNLTLKSESVNALPEAGTSLVASSIFSSRRRIVTWRHTVADSLNEPETHRKQAGSPPNGRRPHVGGPALSGKFRPASLGAAQ